jgi:hypothetical protein
MAITEKLFGVWFPTWVEAVIYNFTERLSMNYTGRYWTFYQLSNGGFYMAHAGDRIFHMICDNRFEGNLTSDVFGITVCLYPFSNLPFAGLDAFADICSDHYYWLREFMLEHPEVEAVLRATD